MTQAPLRQEIAAVTVPTKAGGHNIAGEDFAVTTGWSHYGQGDGVMPGHGRAVERAFSHDERAAMGDALPVLCHRTFDIYLNGEAFWCNIPASVATKCSRNGFTYRERDIRRRPLRVEEVQHFTDTARRICDILGMSRERIWNK